MKGIVKILISHDMMSATAMVVPDAENEITVDYIRRELGEVGVKAGIDQGIMYSIVEGKITGEIEIATGKPAVPGVGAHYDYYFDVSKMDYKPEIQEDGTVDYTFQRQIVRRGDLLAYYAPQKPGSFGYTVTAGVVAPVIQEDEPELKLDGVVKIDDNLFADRDGEIQLADGKLSVIPVLNINGDATNTRGDIVFTGDICVSGDVLSGTVIKAVGNVYVNGTVEAAIIESAGDVTIRKGILGQEKAIITAKGDVKAAFIEEANVTANGSIKCNYAYCSTIHAMNDFVAEGKNGSIIGGRVTALNKIIVKNAGNDAMVKTELEIINDGTGIESTSFIRIERNIYPGASVIFGGKQGDAKPYEGEYHLVNGVIRYYAIGTFVMEKVEMPVFKPPVKKTIMIVDDEPMILKTFFSYLKEDYTVIVVNSVKDAYKAMDRTIPDLILLDVNMPGTNGIEMLEQMRKQTWKLYSNVPVIFATAVTDRSIVQKCLSLFPQGYIIKPLGEKELKESVAKFFAAEVIQ